MFIFMMEIKKLKLYNKLIKKEKIMEKFEDYLKELNDIVTELESGKLSLDESIKKYQRGIELSNLCKKQLEEAKEIIVKKIED